MLGVVLDLIKKVLELDGKIKSIAQELYQQKSLLVMGRGFNYATCLEGALVSQSTSPQRPGFSLAQSSAALYHQRVLSRDILYYDFIMLNVFPERQFTALPVQHRKFMCLPHNVLCCVISAEQYTCLSV